MAYVRPTFSIVMPTHNSERYVQETIESVWRQTLSSWELLIVDDASGDGTKELLKGLVGSDVRIRVRCLPANVGPAKARNMAISHATGRYIAFLDSDDIWRDDKLERQLGVFEQRGAVLAYSGYEKINESGDVKGRTVAVPESVSYKELLGATVIATCTAAYDTAKVGKVLMPDIRKRQDFGLWLKILRTSGELAWGLNEPLAYLRKRPGSVSSNKLAAASYVWRVYRELEGLSVGVSMFYFLKYAYHATGKARI